MKKIYLIRKAVLTAFAFTFSLFAWQIAGATHIAGSELTYKNISGNTYQLTLTLYRDCVGSQMGQNDQITVQSTSCSVQPFTVQVNQVAGTGQEITFPCATGGTTCSGGSAFGVQKYVYTGTVTLPSKCADWVFSWSRCCRNCAINTTIHGNCNSNNDIQSNSYLEARLNNLTVPGNNSPTFSVNPVATLCLGQAFSYNHGVVDADGDLLVYSLIGSQVGPGTTVTYQPGYSATNPINSSPPITIDTTNGDLKMTPQSIETGVMAVRIDEYRSGVWVGSVMRDLQFIVQTCNNSLPTATGINGTSVYDTIICPGTQLCYYIFTNDPDAGQFVSLTSNNTIPNSVFNNSGGLHPTGSFCWTPTQADARMNPWTFVAQVIDDACPTNGLQAYAFSVLIPYMNPNAATDDATGSIDLTVTGNTGGYTYLWSDGETTEDVAGLAPGTYTVTICEMHGCCITAEYIINPPVNCSITVGSQHHNPSCGGVCDGWIHLIPHGTPPFTYLWSNGDTTQTVSGLCAGHYVYTVTDSAGCTHHCNYNLTQAPPMTVTCSASNTCNGANLGTATVSVIGGTPPYNYVWDNGDSTSTITGLCKATYCVVVTDVNGCTGYCCASVASFQAINSIATISNATASGTCDGQFSASASGGTGPYTFHWSTGAVATGVTSDSISGLCPGTYTVTITDQNGCLRKVIRTVGPIVVRFSPSNIDQVQNVTAQGRVGDDDNSNTFKAAVVPNPFSNDFIIQTESGESMQVNIYNMTGALVREYKNVLDGKRIGSDLSSGLYIMEIQQAGEIVYKRIAKQNQ